MTGRISRWRSVDARMAEVEQGILNCAEDEVPFFELEEWELLGSIAPEENAVSATSDGPNGDQRTTLRIPLLSTHQTEG